MNPDGMSPEEMQEFLRNQAYTFKMTLSDSDIKSFVTAFEELQHDIVEDILETDETSMDEAKAVIARVMAL